MTTLWSDQAQAPGERTRNVAEQAELSSDPEHPLAEQSSENATLIDEIEQLRRRLADARWPETRLRWNSGL
jgi:hypothetical protein